MNSKISCSRLVAAALCGAVLAGCNAVEDVREDPFTAVPPQPVVLQGQITGLGTRRPVVLQNNGVSECVNPINATGAKVLCSFQAAAGAVVTPFTFGAINDGAAYNITVRTQPFGKICTVANGAGVANGDNPLQPGDIAVTCANDPAVPRYSVTVTVPSTFGSLQGAKVTLATEEGVLTQIPAAGATSVVFPSAVFNSQSSLPLFQYVVAASYTQDGNLNRCVVTNSTNRATGGTGDVQIPIGNVPNATNLAPTVGACTFTIGGTVAYSTPVGGTPQTMPGSGLTLQLRNVQGALVDTLNYTGGYGASGTTSGAAGAAFSFATPRTSNPNAVFDVAVSSHPTGQFCVVSNGGGATLSVSDSVAAGVVTAPNPGNLTTVNVRCRATPTNPNNVLRGVYQLTSANTLTTTVTGTAPATTTAVATGTYHFRNGSTVVTVTTAPAPAAVTTATTSPTTYIRNFIAFFTDGTFLMGTHASATVGQVEHGFYTYDQALGRLYFTLITDTTTGGANAPSGGLSGMPGPVVVPTGTPPAGITAATHYAMANVAKTAGANGTLTGTFGSLGSTATTNRNSWTLTEPDSTPGQMTGSWITQDHRRMWSFDYSSTMGYHVGVNGGAANMQNACYTLEDHTAASGIYTRRGTLTGCLQGFATGALQTIDIPNGTALLALPGFVGRMPGAETAFDGRSPSPTYFQVAPSATFFSVASPDFFPTVPVTWCPANTDMLGARSSLHGVAINQPAYFCRERAN